MRCFKAQPTPLYFSLAVFSVVFFFFIPTLVAGIDGKNSDGSTTAGNKRDILLTPGEIQWLKTHKTVQVSGPGAFPPFRYFENGLVKGMASDYTRFLAEFIGLRIELEKNLLWPEVLEKAREKKIDLLSCTAKTVERETYLLFSRPFLSFPMVIISRKDAPFIGGLNDLHGKKIAMIRDISTRDWLKQDNIHFVPHMVDSPLSALRAVSTGKANVCIGNLASTTYQIEKFGLTNLKVAAPTTYGNYALSFAVRKDWPELVSIINKALKVMTPEDHATIRNRWLSVRYEHGISKTEVFLWLLGVGCVAFLIVAFFFFWNRKLKKEIKGRRRAQKDLRKSEEKYRLLVENQSDMVIKIDPEGNFLFVSPSYCATFGKTEDELIGRSFIPLIHEDDPITTSEVMKKLHSSPNTAYMEREVMTKESLRWFAWAYKAVLDQNQGVISIVGVGRDITEKRKNEESLLVSEDRYRTLFEESPISLWEEDFSEVKNQIDILRNNGIQDFRTYFRNNRDILRHFSSLVKIVHVNKTTLQLYEADSAESFLTGLPSIFSEESLDAFLEELLALFAGKTTFELECINRTLTGKKLVLKMRWTVAPGYEETFARVFISLINMTEIKQTEEALRESEKRYRSLVENASEAIFIAQDDVIKFANSKTEELSGYSKHELQRIPFVDMIHSEDREMVLEYFRRRMDGEKLPDVYAFRLADRELWVELNTVIIDWEGKPATLHFLRDITEKRGLEEQLQQAHKMESIGTMAGGIAHDFNNILGIIVGNTELAVLTVPVEHPVQNKLREIHKACNRAKDVIRQILSFSRKSQSEYKPINIAPVVKETLKLLRASTPANIEIQSFVDGDIATILADPTQIHQVIINLCNNASQSMEEEGGKLRITLQNIQIGADEASRVHDLTPGAYARLTVNDTGHGIDAEVIDRVFDPYFTTKERGKGTGMGLAVVHGIVKAHHGTVLVDSKRGKGTTFHLLFPVIEKKAQEIPLESPALPTGDETILLVDDEESMTEIIGQMLEKLGYQVISRTDPLDALHLFALDPDQIDLIVTDMAMPEMTGEKLARQIMELRTDFPIIVTTGYSRMMDAAKAHKMGIKAFIMKPVTMSELAQTVRNVLDRI